MLFCATQLVNFIIKVGFNLLINFFSFFTKIIHIKNICIIIKHNAFVVSSAQNIGMNADVKKDKHQ